MMAKEKMISSMKTSISSSSQSHQEGALHSTHKPRLTRLHQLQAESGAAADAAAGEKRSSESGAANDINQRAEDFINRFRQDLQLQRLQSIENYRQMLARGL